MRAKGKFAAIVAMAAMIVGVTAACIQQEAPKQDLTGLVTDTSNGQPVEGAAVTFRSTEEGGPSAITVFTDSEGRFQLSGLPETIDLTTAMSARLIGYRQVEDGVRRDPKETQRITIYVQPVADIANEAPASAWFSQMPAGQDRDITIASCSSCHQVPSEKMRDYAMKIEAVRGGPDGDSKALMQWRSVVRHEAWRTIVKYMRGQHYSVFPLESAMNLDAIDWPTTINADLNFFNERQGEVVAQFLTDNFQLSSNALAASNYRYDAPLGVTGKTRIREFKLPDDALVRELTFAPGSPYLWGADVRRNFILRLDPKSGAQKWYPVDFKGATGPHTIAPDDQGRLWVSMVDNDQFGMFDPSTEKWKLWTLRPSNLPEGASMAAAAIVHDMSIDDRGHLARDLAGRIWITLVGTNQMGTLNPDTGEITFNDTNTIPGLSPINHLIYATVLSEDGSCAWYSQVNGHVSCLDTKTMKATKTVRFEEGVGPRRMARDKAGNLWVALFGSGQLARIDMASGRLAQIIDLPDRLSAPYAVTWDEKRKSAWVATANSDAIYKVSAETGKVTIFPLPRRMGYLRQISLSHETGQLAASYGNYPAGSGPSMAVLIDVGD